MHGRITLPIFAIALIVAGCQDARYVTHEQFDAWAAAHTAPIPAAVIPPDNTASITHLENALKAIKQAQHITAQNLANADTTGYKAARVEFADGGTTAHEVIDFTVGSPIKTNGDFDIMIQGEGFFKVMPRGAQHDGIAYTRAGNFTRNRDGDLVLGSSNGPRLEPTINIPEGATGIEITQDGTLSAFLPGSVAPTMLGQIELAYFTNPTQLIRIQAHLFRETPESGPPIENYPGNGVTGTILHKFLESSNLDPDIELLAAKRYAKRYQQVREAIMLMDGTLAPN